MRHTSISSWLFSFPLLASSVMPICGLILYMRKDILETLILVYVHHMCPNRPKLHFFSNFSIQWSSKVPFKFLSTLYNDSFWLSHAGGHKKSEKMEFSMEIFLHKITLIFIKNKIFDSTYIIIHSNNFEEMKKSIPK